MQNFVYWILLLSIDLAVSFNLSIIYFEGGYFFPIFLGILLPIAMWKNRKKIYDLIKSETLTKKGQARSNIIEEVQKSILSNSCLGSLEKKISDISKTTIISDKLKTDLLIKGWEKSVDKFLDDGVLQQEEEASLVKFYQHFGLTQDQLDRNGVFKKIAKAATLRKVMNGDMPEIIVDRSSINLQKGEKIIWAFNDVKYLEDKNKRQYVGGSQGVSIRIAKGVYYKAGGFKGQSISVKERIHIDTGAVFVTNKHIYFSGEQKSLRVPYSKIVSFLPFSDGIGFIRDTATALPQILVTNDGWFSYNLITNISKQHD